MSVFDESFRRMQVVAGLEYIIEASLGALSSVLGCDLIELLQYYRRLLNNYHEIMTWQRMTVGSLQLSPSRIEALLRSLSDIPADESGDMHSPKHSRQRIRDSLSRIVGSSLVSNVVVNTASSGALHGSQQGVGQGSRHEASNHGKLPKGSPQRSHQGSHHEVQEHGSHLSASRTGSRHGSASGSQHSLHTPHGSNTASPHGSQHDIRAPDQQHHPHGSITPSPHPSQLDVTRRGSQGGQGSRHGSARGSNQTLLSPHGSRGPSPASSKHSSRPGSRHGSQHGSRPGSAHSSRHSSKKSSKSSGLMKFDSVKSFVPPDVESMISGSDLMGRIHSGITLLDDRVNAQNSVSDIVLPPIGQLGKKSKEETGNKRWTYPRYPTDPTSDMDVLQDYIINNLQVGEQSSMESLVSGSDIRVCNVDADLLKMTFSDLQDTTSYHLMSVQEPVTDVFQRVTIATQTLHNTRLEMESTCRNILRLFRNNPLAVNLIVQQKKGISDNAKRFFGVLMQLRKLILDRLLTSPLEVLERNEYLSDVKKHTAELDALIIQLETELANVIREKDTQVKAMNDIINQLQADITGVQQLSEEYIRRTRQESSKQEFSDAANSMSRQNKLNLEIGTLRAQLLKKKFKLETEIDNWIQKYDTDMGELQDEYDIVEAQYKIEKAQLNELEARFEPLDIEFRHIMEERDVAYRVRKTAEREQQRRLQAAMAIQAWWRSYRVRKACQIKAKKLAKLLAKKNRGKKGKGKGKGKEKEKKVVAEGGETGEALAPAPDATVAGTATTGKENEETEKKEKGKKGKGKGKGKGKKEAPEGVETGEVTALAPALAAAPAMAMAEATAPEMADALAPTMAEDPGPAADGTVDDTVAGTVDATVDGAVAGTVDGTVDATVDGPVAGTVDGAVAGTVDGTVDATVDGAVAGTVDGTVDATVDGAVTGTVDGTVDATVDGAVAGTVVATVDGAVDGTVDATVDGATINGNEKEETEKPPEPDNEPDKTE